VIGVYADLARAHAPVLTLALLLGGAAAAWVTPHARLSWIVALGAAVLGFAATLELAIEALFSVRVNFGGAGVALSVDGVGAFAAPLLACGASLAILAGAPNLRLLNKGAGPHAMALGLCVASGWIGALLARDFVGLVIAAQVAWLAGVSLVAMHGENERGALNGALRMWTAGGAGAAMMLLGLGLVTRAVGSADIAAAALTPVGAPDAAAIGYVLIIIPLALAAGVAPLHSWAGAALGRGGSMAALMLGAVGSIGAIAVLTRVAAFAAAAPGVAARIGVALAILGAVSVLVGAVQAAGAVNLRRMIAYAGATQAGCVLIAVALGSPAGVSAALVQLFAWAAAALALLVGAAAARGAEVNALDGLIRRAPVASIAITVGTLSLMGAPLTIGFLGRWRLIEASVGAGWWWATGAVIVASLAAVFYGGRLIERIYFRRAAEALAADRDIWRGLRAPVAVAAIAAIALGAAPSALISAADRAAALVLGHPP